MPGFTRAVGFLRQPGNQRLVAIAGLLLLGVWLAWMQEGTRTPPHASLPGEHGEPEAYIEEARVKRYNASGQHFQTLQAERATHYPEANLSQFAQPRIDHWTTSGQLWVLTARTGELQDQNKLLLQEDVRLQPENPGSLYTPELGTTRLWLNLEEGQAFTSDPVHFTSPAGSTHARGLKATLETGQLELLSQVKSHYTLPNLITAPNSITPPGLIEIEQEKDFR